MDTEKIYFNAFNQFPEIGSVRFRRLLNFFPDLETAWRASLSELKQAGLEEPVALKVYEAKQSIDPGIEFEKLRSHDVELITFKDQTYPKLLREIPAPPMVLYKRGELLPQDELAVAMVGTRKMSAYGKRVSEDLVAGLLRAQISIVSGLALGIDALVHEATMRFGGRTIAVLACGLDSVYPAANRVLAEKIIAGSGALISELPLGMPPLKHHFPHRNRIIAGISLGTVVIEAAADSGALITATHALEQNRQVFAVPGSIYNPVSAGPNNLIKMGAKPVTSALDILEDLNLLDASQEVQTRVVFGENSEEQKILDALSAEPLHFDEVTKLVKLSASVVAATLTIMEMKGKVRNLGGNQYVKGR